MKVRFTIKKSHSNNKPWMVEDRAGDPCEDAILYLFKSKKKAEAFVSMLKDEKLRGVA